MRWLAYQSIVIPEHDDVATRRLAGDVAHGADRV
jgi:hypothetical protein